MNELNDTVVKILGLGISGLAFLLVFMAFLLLRKEQEKDQPRNLIVKTIWMFMGLCLVICISVGSFSLFSSRLSEKQKELDLKTQGFATYKNSDSVESVIQSVSDTGTLTREQLLAIAAQLELSLKHLDTIKTMEGSEPKAVDVTTPAPNTTALKQDIAIIKDPTQDEQTVRSALSRIETQNSIIKTRAMKTNFLIQK